ncbi:RNA-guided endonuclease InsQ/TnpB family protein [Microscilla marina]|uniref:Transposase, OrfB n=1 Tax=Microscilla marina ATCC 23134 TaxID=313606 RepID=A1ZGJ4_MICM2|nr:RNA-guided endonuclease TnpB family protein [Microscilla marina]EAY30611.1 transposase, OrfB [Microscilla marina ATCC 23134]
MLQVVKTYKYKLRNLSVAQTQKLNSWVGACRFVYNLALETKQYVYKAYGVNLSRFDLDKELKTLKDVEWIKDVPSQSLQDVLQRLEKAYQSFFKGGGFPKWAKKGKYNSITLKSVNWDNCEKGRFVLPKLGEVKTFYSREIPKEAKLRRATIIKESDGFYISIMFSTTIQPLPSNNQTVGLDWGVEHFLTTSDSEHIANPRLFQRYQKKLRVEKRSLSRKKKGESNFKKQARKLAKLQTKIARIRNDFQHKISTGLILKYGSISVENLKVRNMTGSAKGNAEEPGKNVKAKAGLNRAILDTAPSMFLDKLEYKSKWHGRTFVKINPKHTSQICSECGHKDKESRITQAKFVCSSCNTELNADVNAAKNIEARAFASIR